jgi:hypothetical protein
VKTVLFISFITAFLFSILSSTAVAGPSDYDCYRHGKQTYYKYKEAIANKRLQGCRQHSMGAMTPWLGGYYDAKYGNSKYLNKHKWGNNSNNSSSSSPGSSSYSKGGSKPAKWSAWLHIPIRSGQSNCIDRDYPTKYRGYCYQKCPDGYYGYHFPGPSDLCVKCPAGTKSVSTDNRGVPVCNQ